MHEVLAELQAFLTRPDTAGRVLAVVVPADLAGSAVAGLVRVAQSENPGRVVLVDADAEVDVVSLVSGALAAGESQVRVRDGVVSVPRLVRADVPEVEVPGLG